MEFIPFNKPFIAGKELYYIAQAVLLNRHTSGDGPFTKKCQEWLENRLDCTRAFLTHSCTAALEISAILAGIEPGDEIVMPSFTFVSTANAFVLRGAVPVFIDVKADTLNIDERLVEKAITARTKAILTVHYAGVSCAMDEIVDIAEKRSLFVIEDAAQALMSKYKGRFLGTLGHFGCVSFHETKNIICGEGGALLVNDPSFIERAEIIRDKGTNRSKFFRGQLDKYTWVDIGSSYLPSDILSAFLYAQMEHADQIISKRNLIYERYMASLRPLAEAGHIQLPFIPGDHDCNGHIFYIITKSLRERTALIEYLKGKNILSVFHYVPLHDSPAGRFYGRASGKLKITQDISRRLLRLPLYYEMSERDVDYVVDEIKQFYRRKR